MWDTFQAAIKESLLIHVQQTHLHQIWLQIQETEERNKTEKPVSLSSKTLKPNAEKELNRKTAT